MRVDRSGRPTGRCMPRGGIARCGVIVGVAFGFVATAGCGDDPLDVCFLGNPGGSYQLAPSSQAVAFVNRESYKCILDAGQDIRPGFVCVIKEFTARFENTPDSIVVVFDFENMFTTMSRLYLEQGFDLFDFDLPDEEYVRSLQVGREVRATMATMPEQKQAAFNSTLRVFEHGLGSPTLPTFPAGPPSLRGFLFLPTKEDLVAGRFLHEFCHHWAAYLDGPPVLAAQLSAFDGHWGYSSVGGLLGGWEPGTLVSDGGGVYEARVSPAGRGSNKHPYAPLELYLMGLVGPAEVPPIEVAVGVEKLGTTEDNDVIFSASAIEMVTIEEIIAANGARQPALEDAPKCMKLALIILADHELSAEEWDYYERGVGFMAAPEEQFLNEAMPLELYRAHHNVWKSFSQEDMDENGSPNFSYLNFFSATGGRGTIEFEELVPRKKVHQDVP